MSPPTGRWVYNLIALALAACSDSATPTFVRLAPVVRADRDSNVLLRPRGIALEAPGGRIAVIEEGRRTLTTLGDSGVVLARRPLWTDDLGDLVVPNPTHDAGSVLVRGDGGFWTLVAGLGPVFLDDGATAPQLLGAGAGGRPPDGDMNVADADLSDARGLAVDPEGRLVIAAADRLVRVSGDALTAIAGSGEVGTAVAGSADELNLSLGAEVGLAVGREGVVYVTDAGSGRVWAVTDDGFAVPVAGGGDQIGAPLEPIPADALSFQLGSDALAWDGEAAELVLRTRSTLFRIDPGTLDLSSDPPRAAGATVRAVPATFSLPQSIAADEGAVLVTLLGGEVRRVARDGQGNEEAVTVWSATATTPLDLGRAAAVETVGTGALLIQDPAQRRVALHLPQAGTFTLLEARSPASPAVQHVVANSGGDIFFVSTDGLLHTRVNGPTRVLATRVPAPFVPGQRVDQIMLPIAGELRGAGEDLVWLLDQCTRLLLRFDMTTGLVSHLAGAANGGARPTAEHDVQLTVLGLEAPASLAVDGGLAVLADRVAGSVAVYGLNTGAAPLAIAGVPADPGRAVYLGGQGDLPFEEGLGFQELSLSEVRRLAVGGGSLFVSTGDTSAPPLIRIDEAGAVSAVLPPTEEPPDALATAGAEVVVAGWEHRDFVEVANLSGAPREVLGIEVGPGEWATVAMVPGGVLDLALDQQDAGALYALDVGGGIHRVTSTGSELIGRPDGETETRSMALIERGGVLLLRAGGLWAVDGGGDASFLGEPLPPSPGAQIITPTEGWSPTTRLGTLAFGTNVTGLALGPEGSLVFTDHLLQAALEAVPDESGQLSSESTVALLSRGDPVPEVGGAVMLEVGADKTLYLGAGMGVDALEATGWRHLADAAHLSGMALDDRGLFIRSGAGLALVDREGMVLAETPALATQRFDTSVLALSQSVTLLQGNVVVVVGGDVFEVVGWP